MLGPMQALNRRRIIAISVGAVVAILIGFVLGRATTGDSTSEAGSIGPGATLTSVSSEEGAVHATTTSQVPVMDGDAASILPPESEVPESGLPVYGTEADRNQMLDDLSAAGVAGGTKQGLLATGDHVCFNLERLTEQHRSRAFAVRVVWNESLGDLPSEDVAAFGVVFNSAPHYLCPEYVEYAESIAYWLGF